MRRSLSNTTCRAAVIALGLAGIAAARTPEEPIRLVWDEGDVAGMTTILDPDDRKPIGTVQYRQTRRGDRLKTWRVSRFRDGSSDEDVAEARVDGKLEAISGRSTIRDRKGRKIVEISIDVPAQRIRAEWSDGDDRETMNEEMEIPKGTYWGPLIHIVLKNFEANEEDGRVVFHTIAPTPKPRAIDMEFRRGGKEKIELPGVSLETRRFALSPTIHWLVDPIVRRFAPNVAYWVIPGEPPALGRFIGPRNYAQQRVIIE